MEKLINHLNASFIYSVAKMGARPINGAMTLRDAKSYIHFRLSNDGVREGFDFDGKATAVFQKPLGAQTKADFISLMLEIAIEADAVHKAFCDERRAAMVIKRCADRGYYVTIEEVKKTRAAVEDRNYSVHAAVMELCLRK